LCTARAPVVDVCAASAARSRSPFVVNVDGGEVVGANVIDAHEPRLALGCAKACRTGTPFFRRSPARRRAGHHRDEQSDSTRRPHACERITKIVPIREATM
jgi:hypothetical protein